VTQWSTPPKADGGGPHTGAGEELAAGEFRVFSSHVFSSICVSNNPVDGSCVPQR
jgi:hypothetical protein